MKQYTVGFIFSEDLEKVLLIHKTAPDWQKGKINGIGGKLEEGEELVDCMVRETLEETGVKTEPDNWVYTGAIKGAGDLISTFGYKYSGKLFDAFTFEKEKIEWFPVGKLPENMIMNLTWLIPLTLEKIRENKIIEYKIIYSDF